MDIKKAIIPAAGLGTRFLPLTKVFPKELSPLADEPAISYVVKEAIESGLGEMIFVLREPKKHIIDYFKKDLKLEKILEERGQKQLLEKLKENGHEFENVSFSSVFQRFPKGDGDAVLKAKERIGKEPFAVLFPDDIIESKIPAILQLEKIFNTSRKPVVALKRISEKRLFSYGVVKVEKITSKLYKIKGITEKPKEGKAPSNLAVVGRYVLPPEIFNYLKKTKPNAKGEVILAEALKLMIGDGKMVYGYEISGNWLECGKKIDWLKSNLYFSLKHPKYGPILKEFIKKLKL